MSTLHSRMISLYVPPKLAAELERAVAEHETSLSEYIRSALRSQLAAERRAEEERRP